MPVGYKLRTIAQGVSKQVAAIYTVEWKNAIISELTCFFFNL